MRTLRLGLPGQLNELLKTWFGSYGLSVGAKPIEESQRASIAAEVTGPTTPDLYGGIMETVGWFVVALAASVGAGISGGSGLALVAAGPAGLIAGAVIGAIVAFLAVRVGMDRAKEIAESWNAPAWLVKNILLPSKIVRMRTNFRDRLEETLQRETATLQNELEARICAVTGKQIESLSEIAQL